MPLLELRGLAKSYGAVAALAGVDLVIDEGEVVGLCGDNGAGKSTLIKLVSGADPPSGGQILLDGAAMRFRSPADALARGVATIYQDLALAPRLSIAQNIFMGAERMRRLAPGVAILDKPRMRREAAEFLSRLKVTLPDMDAPVAGLSGGQRQAVAISRALRWNARLVIMDEPTAALGVKEKAQVLDLIRSLHGQGVTVLLVSHNMEDVVAVTTRVAVLKAGRKVADRPTAGLDPQRLGHIVMHGAEAA